MAEERLNAINYGVRITVQDARIDQNFFVPADVHCVADCLDNFVSRFDLYGAVNSGQSFVHGGVQSEHGQVLTLVKGQSQPLDEIFAGSIQPPSPIPVTADSVIIIAGLMCRELFQIIFGTPKLLDRFLVVDLADCNFSFLDVGRGPMPSSK